MKIEGKTEKNENEKEGTIKNIDTKVENAPDDKDKGDVTPTTR